MKFTHRVDEELSLRLILPADADELFEVARANRAHIGQWLPWIAGVESADAIRQALVDWLDATARTGSVTAALETDGRIVGLVYHLRANIDQKFVEIGYWLAEDAQGRGLMTRACRAMFAYAFEVMGMNRVYIRAATDNARSRSVPQRLGCHCEGVHREEAWLNGRWIDHAYYSMLKREWDDGKGSAAELGEGSPQR
jgi:ribosomal-protein-serine acetyltransferase